MEIRKPVPDDFHEPPADGPISVVRRLRTGPARPESLTEGLERFAGIDSVLDGARRRWASTSSLAADGASPNRAMRPL